MIKKAKVVAAFIARGNKFLVSQRRRDDNFPLMWEFPGGKVEKGETLPQALRREMKEELDIIISPDQKMGVFFDEIKSYMIEVTLFSATKIKGTFTPLECVAFKFVDLKQAQHMYFAPVDKKILNFLKKNIF
jgi:8-oxo-dGTP diphosphatase